MCKKLCRRENTLPSILAKCFLAWQQKKITFKIQFHVAHTTGVGAENTTYDIKSPQKVVIRMLAVANNTEQLLLFFLFLVTFKSVFQLSHFYKATIMLDTHLLRLKKLVKKLISDCLLYKYEDLLCCYCDSDVNKDRSIATT